MRQYLDVKFDRPIDANQHYISPGGYEVEIDLPEGKRSVQFDFTEFAGSIDKEDKTILHIEQHDLDTDAFPESTLLIGNIDKITKIVECYMYTGENDEPELKPVQLLSWAIDGTDIPAGVINAFSF